MTEVLLSLLRTNGGTQPRASIDQFVVDDYAEQMRQGVEFPDAVAFYDGTDYWLADGFHRDAAAKQAGRTTLAVDVRQGTQRDAILFSVGANGAHGVRRTNADKRRAVETLLRDAEWSKWSDSEVARRCVVDHKTVSAIKADLTSRGILGNPKIERKVERNGTTFTMNTARIGQTPPAPKHSPPRPIVSPSQKIVEEARDIIRHTQMADDKNAQEALSRVAPEQQATVVERVLAGAAKTVQEAAMKVRQEIRRAEVAATPAPAPELVPARIEVADATEHWPVEDGTVDLIVTSPPYGAGIKYLGNDVTPENWPDFMEAWLRRAYDAAANGGRLCVNIPIDMNFGGYRPSYVQTVNAALAAGWKYRNSIFWAKNHTGGNLQRGSVDSHETVNVICPNEMIAVFYKGDSWSRDDGHRTDVPHEGWQKWTLGHWEINAETSRWDGHPAPFPPELPERLILLYSPTNAVVADPFNGSGTTTMVAHRLGRVAIGFDLEPVYVASAQRRLVQSLKGDQ